MSLTGGACRRLGIRDGFVRKLIEDIAALIAGATELRSSVIERQLELAERQHESVGRYWRGSRRGIGIPTSAFRGSSLYNFPEVEPVRVFRTSGTSGTTRGIAAYSPDGMALLDAAILRQARRHLSSNRDAHSLACIRIIPASETVPDVIMAYGMELIAKELGVPHLSGTAFDGFRFDVNRLEVLVSRALAENVPILLMGSTFGVVNACDAIAERKLRFDLPEGTTLLDAGGLKNRARALTGKQYLELVGQTFGSLRCINLFGMTELVSQLYDSPVESDGTPNARIKGPADWAWPTVREPESLMPTTNGIGLLEITDLAIVDRPSFVLSDDIARGTPVGATILGRALGSPTRGCALHIESLAEEAS
ncbi:MAG: hypothetical protein QM784_38320 [Polyangiaceae bacterium]